MEYITSNGPQILQRIMDEFEKGSVNFNERLAKIKDVAHKVNHFQVVEPTVEWAQDLHRVFMEVKFAHRFDAPGCANHTETEIDLQDDSVTLKVLCHSISSKIKYDLKLHFWESVDSKNSVYTY